MLFDIEIHHRQNTREAGDAGSRVRRHPTFLTQPHPTFPPLFRYVPANDSDLTSGGRYPHALDGFLDVFTVPDDAEKGSGLRRTPREGEIFKNPALGATLRAVQAGGAEEFYNGSVAAAYEAYRNISGLQLTTEDFAAHHGEWVDPVSTTYRDEYVGGGVPLCSGIYSCVWLCPSEVA